MSKDSRTKRPDKIIPHNPHRKGRCGKEREENLMAKQGFYAREDESVGMRLGKSKSKKAMKKKRDESYGLFGKRKVDWSNHQQG